MSVLGGGGAFDLALSSEGLALRAVPAVAPIPLPMGGLLLASALVAFGGFRAARNGR